jgi:hypothetical protein
MDGDTPIHSFHTIAKLHLLVCGRPDFAEIGSWVPALKWLWIPIA